MATILGPQICRRCYFMETYPFLIFSISIAVLAVVFPAILHYTHFRSEKTLRSISATWRNGYSFIFISNALAVVLGIYPYCLCDLAWQIIIILFSVMAFMIFLFNPPDAKTKENETFSLMHTIFAFITFLSMYGISIWVQYEFYTFGDTSVQNYAAGIVFFVFNTVTIIGLIIFALFDSWNRKWKIRLLKERGVADDDPRIVKLKNDPWPWWVAIFENFYVLSWCMQILCIPNGIMVDHY